MPFQPGQSGNPKTVFKPGQSGNLNGRPKGAVGLKTIIRKITEDDEMDWGLVPIKDSHKIAAKYGNNAWVAIVYTAVGKAMSGDIRAMEWLRKAQYGDKPNLGNDDKPTQPLFVYDFSPPKSKRKKPASQIS